MFFITGLPRSRTAWMAAFCSTGSVVCHHELMGQVSSKQEFWDEMARDNRGNSDHAHFLLGELGRVSSPPRVVIIHRPIDDVHQSLVAIGIDNRPFLEENLAGIESMVGLHVQYSELDSRLEQICDYVGVPFTKARARLYKKLNIQTTHRSGDPSTLAMWRQ